MEELRCPKCGSTKVLHTADLDNLYKCQTCNSMWGILNLSYAGVRQLPKQEIPNELPSELVINGIKYKRED